METSNNNSEVIRVLHIGEHELWQLCHNPRHPNYPDERNYIIREKVPTKNGGFTIQHSFCSTKRTANEAWKRESARFMRTWS